MATAERSSPRLYSTAFILWLGAAAPALAGLLFWALVARLYPAKDVGLAAAALSAASLLATFSHLGLGSGLIRFLPEMPPAAAPRLTNAVLTTAAVCAVATTAAFLLGIPWWTPSLAFLRQHLLYALAFVAFVALATVSGVQGQALIAVKKPSYILVQVTVVQTGRLALPALLAVYFGAFGIVAAAAAAMALGTALGFGLMARGLSGYRPSPVVDAAAVGALLPFSAGNYLADVLLLAPGLLLPLLVIGELGSTAGAYFFIAWFLGQLLTAASANLALSLFAEGSHDPSSLRSLSRDALVAGLLVAAVGAVLLAGLADRLLLLFGPGYAAEGSALLRIVAVAAVPAAVVNVYLGALRVSKRIGEVVGIAGLTAAATMALSYTLLPQMGLTGAGLAYGAAQGIGLLVVIARLIRTPEGAVGQGLHKLWRLLAAG